MLPRDNPESWRRIHEFIERFPEADFWSAWKPVAREIVSALEKLGLGDSFRIGQSMHHIIFSTLDHHELGTAPRVTIEIHPGEQAVRVAYSSANLYFSDSQSEEQVPRAAAVTTILRYLRRLWIETKSEQSIPEALKKEGEQAS